MPTSQRGLALREFIDKQPLGTVIDFVSAFKTGWDAQTTRVADLEKEIEELKEERNKMAGVILRQHSQNAGPYTVGGRQHLQEKHDALEEEIAKLKAASLAIGPPFHAWRHVPDWEWSTRPWECPNCHLVSGRKTRDRCPA
jgi:uncharacterized small protein (DUF1192 family)